MELQGAAPLLWSLSEAARQLGDVSTRTVRRLLVRGDLPSVRVGRRLCVPSLAVREWVTKQSGPAHNPERAGPAMREEKTWHTDAKIVPFIGSASPTQAARELDVLLKRPPARKQKH
ncbi:MAG: DNA-binding protein [Gammaproteobacteria bacterium]|nr:MAG: DNA-binding protein [Gammaproteobacteria bacterium]